MARIETRTCKFCGKKFKPNKWNPTTQTSCRSSKCLRTANRKNQAASRAAKMADQTVANEVRAKNAAQARKRRAFEREKLSDQKKTTGQCICPEQ